MTTTLNQLENMLIANGMFANQAKQVAELGKSVIEDAFTGEDEPKYQISWDRPSDEYPDIIYSLMFKVIKPVAAKWIEENIPQAWFKPMFKQ